MRVIFGTKKGKPLLSVPGDTTRPMLSRVKTALFDTIRPRLAAAQVLDCFAGTGQLGIEALSNGAESCIFLDTERAAVETIKKNLSTTQLTELTQVRHTDVFTYLKNCQKSFEIIVADPPQVKNLWVEVVHCLAERPTILSEGGVLIVKVDPSEYEGLQLKTLNEVQQRRYGNSVILFFERTSVGSFLAE
jgi:16S rRNA (guanine(966)-N(2))-methyltransferase RsmD